MSEVVEFSARRTRRYPNDPTGSDVEGQGAMPHILILKEALLTRSRRTVRHGARQGLHPAQFSAGNDQFTLLGQLGCLLIQAINHFALAGKGFVLHCSSPIAALVRTNGRFF
jgi:hypothetical protein